jgi:hypothetical protein
VRANTPAAVTGGKRDGSAARRTAGRLSWGIAGRISRGAARKLVGIRIDEARFLADVSAAFEKFAVHVDDAD